ncbi:MAG: hypothetical protein AB8B95_14580 [Pseudohongiellaceae bacterium]
MAIFQKAYQGYSGELSGNIDRTLVIFRYAMADVFKSRLFAAFFVATLLFPLSLICTLYVYHNLDLLVQLEIVLSELAPIDGSLVAAVMQLPQNTILFFLVLAVGPTMISPDLRNNAMPLILSRSISKTNYIAGKMLVLLVLGSLISWIPALVIFVLQAFLASDGWLAQNWHLPLASMITSLSWIIVLSLLAFAISAFVKWKTVARIVFFSIIAISSILGEVIQEIFGGMSGHLVNINAALQVLVANTFDASSDMVITYPDMPLWIALVQLLTLASVSLFLLSRRIRAFQVVS